jgi:hypothetical protein
MENTNKRLDSRVNAVANINHLSGLIQGVTALIFKFLHMSTGHIADTSGAVGKQGEAWCHLQARRVLRQGVPRCRA